MARGNRKQILIEFLKDEETLISIEEKLDILMERVDLIMSAIVIQQKDAAQLAGISAATIRNYVRDGKIQSLQKDGSRLQYFTLKQVENMRCRNSSKK